MIRIPPVSYRSKEEQRRRAVHPKDLNAIYHSEFSKFNNLNNPNRWYKRNKSYVMS
ncbi:Hypothetical protein FKW44_025085 [Caligus rogercresseyi]|uniref:Uncharacterized protein n=1 Tax=Caligus rogercresseyi TaxID=217165 RepID=A0A7T8GKR4_CALRO|nr:Hypothetical protein FKW44_025085 [Caligus rogercresseyi]